MKLEPTGDNAALAAELGGQAKRLGLKAWAVGGCVRDWLMGRPAKDMDIVSDSRCEALAQYCRRKYGASTEAFGSFGTMRCFFPDGSRLDLANARAEAYSKPAALPVVRPASLQRDLRRRDFTVNAIAASIMPDDLWDLKDPFHGIADIERGELKALHAKSFADDPTRMYRACRFAGRFGWKIQPAALAQLRRAVLKNLPALLSRARLRQELWRILEEKNPAPAFRLLRRYKLDDFIFPGLRWPSSADAVADAEARLGVLACAIGNGSADFLASLEMERGLCAELKAAAELHRKRRAPAKELSELQKRVLRACNPALPSMALEPAIVGGDFLRRQGLEPGAEFAGIIADAAEAQWQGLFSGPGAALAWFKKYRIGLAAKRRK